MSGITKLLKPIYDLTMIGRQFIWEEEQQNVLMRLKGDYKACQY